MEETRSFPLKIQIRNYAVSFLNYILFRQDATVNRLLHNFLEYCALFLFPSSNPRNGVVSLDYTVDQARNLWFRIYFPVDCSSQAQLPVIVYFHGGGFAFFSPKIMVYDDLCRRLARKLPAVVISVNYRLSPEARCPSQYDDGFDVLRHVDENDMGVGDLSRCFLAGDSAGANLSHHVAVRVSGYGFKRIRIRGVVSIQPFFGGEDRTESELRFGKDLSLALNLKTTDLFWKAFLPVGSDRNHPSVNIFESGVDMAGIEYPPTLVFVGGLDLLQDWQRKYADWLVGSGKEVRVVEYPNMFHGFYVVPELPEASMLVDEVRRFIRLRINQN